MRPTKSPLQAMAIYSAILSQLVGSVLIGVFTGMWLDEKIGTAPFFMIICLFIGITAGVWQCFRLSANSNQETSRKWMDLGRFIQGLKR